MNLVNRCVDCIFLTLILMPIQGCARDYSAKSIEAWVVDAETGVPLVGANVVARWELSYGLEGGGAYQLQVMENVTDKKGRFFFPAWGPKEIPEHLPSRARFQSNVDPEIVVFMSGYRAKHLSNDRPLSEFSGYGPAVRTSIWDGKTIQLSKFHGDINQYVLNIRDAQSGLFFVNRGNNCEWKLLPRMILTLTKEAKLLKEKNVSTQNFYIDSINALPNQAWCGSAQDFFKAYE